MVLLDRKKTLLTDNIDLLKSACNRTKAIMPYKKLAFVFLHDHLHVIWRLPEGDNDYASRWCLLKGFFSKRLKCSGEIWQPRYWEHTIRDNEDFYHHVNYIHYNPVKHGIVSSIAQWPHSSFHWYVRHNMLPHNWCVDNFMGENDQLGE